MLFLQNNQLLVFINLHDDGCIVGLLPETKLPQLFNQIFIHFTHYQ